MRGLNGLRTLVTGAGGGIGRRVVDRLLAEGSVVAVADLEPPAIPGAAFSAGADVTDAAAVETMVRDAGDALGGVQALVATAGIQATGPTHQIEPELFRRVIDVNVMGTFHVVRAVLPQMMSLGGGRIVTFGSTAAVVAAPQLAAYAAAKGAVLQFTRSVAAEYARLGIRANCLCPGGTATPMLADIEARRAGADGADNFRERHPVGRYADPEEIAAAAAFLLSDDASFVLGSAFMVDGGFTCV